MKGTPLKLAMLNVKSTLSEMEFYEKHPGVIMGVPTGIRQLDFYLNGLVPGRSCMFVARPGMGKTTGVLNIANNAASQGKRVAIFELEMNETEIVKRLASIRSGIPEMAIRTGYFSSTGERLGPEHYAQFRYSVEEIAKLPIGIYVGGITTDQLWATLEQIHDRTDLVIIDHVGRFTDNGGMSQYQRMTYVSRALKDMRLAFDLPYLLVAQLNRGASDPMRKDSRPVLSDVRDTGAFEEDVDQMVAVWREDYGSREESGPLSRTELIVLKNRYGPTGTVYCDMSLATGRIHERGANAQE